MSMYMITNISTGTVYEFPSEEEAIDYIRLHKLSGRLWWQSGRYKERADCGAYLRGKPYSANVNERDATP